MAKNIITTEWQHDMVLQSDNPSGHSITIDTESDFGGTNAGVRPKALMLSALGGCTGLDVVSLLKKMKVTVDSFKVVVTAELTDDHPKYYNTVKVDYFFTGNDLNEAKINKAVNLSAERYCGVYEMFRQFAEVSFEVHIY
jgi:putative redox protein